MEVIILLLMFLVVIAGFMVSRFWQHGNPYPFHKKGQLFTQVERSFLLLLERAVGEQYKIINRVKLADILELKENADQKSRRAALLKLNAKYLDYVLCNKEDMSVIAVIDLTNVQQKNGHKSVPDWFVSGALEASGIPYIRMKIMSGYTIADIQNTLLAKIGPVALAPQPIVKGSVKKGPTRPVRPLAASPSSNTVIKNQVPALVQLS